jgi:hypothetical protein
MAKPRFANLIRGDEEAPPPPATADTKAPPTLVPAARRPSRDGKKAVMGHFSPTLVRTLNLLAVEEDTTLQALLGEGIDLVLRARGKHPFGER